MDVRVHGVAAWRGRMAWPHGVAAWRGRMAWPHGVAAWRKKHHFRPRVKPMTAPSPAPPWRASRKKSTNLLSFAAIDALPDVLEGMRAWDPA